MGPVQPCIAVAVLLLLLGSEQSSGITTDSGAAISSFATEWYDDITSPTTVPLVEECHTVSCKRLAGRMLAQMGHDAKPCDNFYKYACGGMHNDPFLLEYDYTKDVWDRIQRVIIKSKDSSQEYKTFKDFYTSCTAKKTREIEDQEWIDEVIAALNETGTFNFMSAKELNFTKLFTGFIKYNSALVFDIMLDVDESNSSRYVLKMSIPSRENFFVDPEDLVYDCRKENEAKDEEEPNMNLIYKTFKDCTGEKLKRSAGELMALLIMLNVSESFDVNLQDASEIVYHLETFYKWNSKVVPSESHHKHSILSKSYKLVTVEELNERYSVVEWNILLRNLLHREIPESTSIQLYFEDYFDKIFYTIKKNKINMYNSLLANFVHKLYADLLLHKKSDARYCLRVATNLLEDVAAAAYASSFHAGELAAMGAGARNMFSQLKGALQGRLQAAGWLDDGSRSLLQAKLHGLRLELPGDLTYLLHRGASYNMDPGEYVKNAMVLLRRHRTLMYTTYDQNPEDPMNIWTHFLYPHYIAAKAVYELNLIAIPFGLIANPFYDQAYPKYVTMARLGSVLAREMARHFDAIGLQFSPGAGKGKLLLGTAEEYYMGMEECFRMQYSFVMTRKALDGRNVEFELNFILLKEERLAEDISALLVHSFLKNNSFDSEPVLPFLQLPNDKAFFLLLAQNFCSDQSLFYSAISLFEDSKLPPFLRVNQIASTSKEFSETFKCPSVPPCEVFPDLTKSSHEFYEDKMDYPETH